MDAPEGLDLLSRSGRTRCGKAGSSGKRTGSRDLSKVLRKRTKLGPRYMLDNAQLERDWKPLTGTGTPDTAIVRGWEDIAAAQGEWQRTRPIGAQRLLCWAIERNY